LKNLDSEVSRLKLGLNILVLGVSLFGMSRQDLRLGDPTIFETLLVESLAPMQSGVVSTRERIASWVNDYILIVNTNKLNRRLTKELAELKGEIFHLEEVLKENKRLKELLQFGEEIKRKKVLAQVIGWDSSNQFRVLRVNKGSNSGILPKSPVVTADGLVGYVYRVAKNYSDILTILDRNNRVDAIITRTRSHGIVEGLSNFKCYMKYVVRKEPVQSGDLVITAGLGTIYPKGLKIGSVSRIEKESYGITQFIEIDPSVNFHKIEEVAILGKVDESVGEESPIRGDDDEI